MRLSMLSAMSVGLSCHIASGSSLARRGERLIVKTRLPFQRPWSAIDSEGGP